MYRMFGRTYTYRTYRMYGRTGGRSYGRSYGRGAQMHFRGVSGAHSGGSRGVSGAQLCTTSRSKCGL